MQRFPLHKYERSSRILKEQRAIKSAEEVEVLQEAINITEKILGRSSQFNRYAKIHRAETLFRLGKIDLAYQDCVAISAINSEYSDNYDALLDLSAFYHAVIIKHALGKPITEHQISTFLTKAKTFCEAFFNKTVYESLAEQAVFEIISNDENTLKNFFEKSAKILPAIYGEKHSFITDYVANNTISSAL
jgi:hypothetical protein